MFSYARKMLVDPGSSKKKQNDLNEAKEPHNKSQQKAPTQSGKVLIKPQEKVSNKLQDETFTKAHKEIINLNRTKQLVISDSEFVNIEAKKTLTPRLLYDLALQIDQFCLIETLHRDNFLKNASDSVLINIELGVVTSIRISQIDNIVSLSGQTQAEQRLDRLAQLSVILMSLAARAGHEQAIKNMHAAKAYAEAEQEKMLTKFSNSSLFQKKDTKGASKTTCTKSSSFEIENPNDGASNEQNSVVKTPGKKRKIQTPSFFQRMRTLGCYIFPAGKEKQNKSQKKRKTSLTCAR